MKNIKAENIKASSRWYPMDTTCFLFSDRVLVYSIAKAGVLNRFVDIVVHIFRLLLRLLYLFGSIWSILMYFVPK